MFDGNYFFGLKTRFFKKTRNDGPYCTLKRRASSICQKFHVVNPALASDVQDH